MGRVVLLTLLFAIGVEVAVGKVTNKKILNEVKAANQQILNEIQALKQPSAQTVAPLTSCSIHAQSYSATDTDQHDGFVELNGTRVWNAGWHTSFPNPRGINTMIIDPVSCTASDIRQFDTHASADAALELVVYLKWIRDGAVILGVTCDEPTKQLSESPVPLRWLKAAAVDVADVQSRGNFVFVVQKGYPEKTMMVKSTTNAQPTSLLNVLAQGSSVNDLEFIPQ